MTDINLHFAVPGTYKIYPISIRLEADQSMAGRLDELKAMLQQQGQQTMKALDDIKAEMDDLETRAANIESKADAAAAVLTTIGQRLIDEAAAATDLAALQERMTTMGTDLQTRADNLGAAIDAVPTA